ncbi:MAG TPA: amidohydrolase [Vicinamibacterales bacterium]|nr:amidohydrolase [Vicinamibacterales bacterium]
MDRPPMSIAQCATAVVCVLALACSRPARVGADLVVTRANIWTGDPTERQAAALAIVGDRIVDVGAADEIDHWRGPATVVIDAEGRRVVPGFNDSHVHFVDGGTALDSVDLKDADSPDEFARRIVARARTQPGKWILGGEWDDQRWTPPALPTRALIDDGTGGTPVFVSRYDGHMALANSAALGRAGITEDTPDPPGGAIVRDANGYPTGVLKDAAMDFVTRVIPNKTNDERLRAVKRAMEYAASLGVTSVQDMNPSYEDVAVYAELANRGELTVRIYAAPMETGFYDQAKLGIRRSFGSAWLRLGAVKGYADGSLGSTTAYFFQPYTDAPHTRGLLSAEMQPVEHMRTRLMAADAAGLQLCIHAVGDAGISQILDLFGDVVRANGDRDRRLRIEHAQHIAPKDFDRFAALKVIASVQPYHAIDDGRWAERRIGAERIKTTYAFRTLVDKGVHLAFGSDWPVAPLNPLLSLYAATTRATLDGKNPNGWVPEQKIGIADAVTAYTRGAAFAEFQERDKGTIARGRLADLVILTDDILAIPAAQIKDVRVLTTIIGGKVVYQRRP